MVKVYKCKRCKHEWAGRLSRPPRVCPACNSPYWNKSKRKGVDNNIQKELSIEDRVTYNYLQSRWSNWMSTAERLIRIAYKLESERFTEDERFVDFNNGDVYYMLIGYALENYLKGAIVQDLLMGGKSLDEDKLEGIIRHHDISELFSAAGLEVKSKRCHSDFDYLTECIEWRGRYPLPVEAKRIGGSIEYHPPGKDGYLIEVVSEDINGIPIDVIHEYVNMAKANLEHVIQKAKARNL